MTIARAVLLAVALLLAAGLAPRPAHASEVAVGFYVIDVREMDLKKESFFADFYFWMRYGSTDEEHAKEIERFEVMNGRLDLREENDRKRLGDQTYVCWRLTGTFFFRSQLRAYPFDSQTLPIVIEHPALDTNFLVYVDDSASYARSASHPDRPGVQEGLSLGDFRLASTSRTVLPWIYKTDFGDPTRPEARQAYSRAVFAMRFVRDFWPYFFKIVIPLLVIVAMAYLVFWLPPKEIQTASGLGITALLSCIAFNVSVAQGLPDVGYLVVSDKFFITTYFLLFLTLAQSVLTYSWNEAGKEELARRWDIGCRFVFPVLYLGAFAYLMAQALTGRG